MAKIVDRCATGLGVSGNVQAELYKLLVYDAGSFFIKHRDTEKIPGMFATLVIVLPSEYQGGELVIKHKQEAVTLDLHRDDAAEVGYAAFYADCVHEILPITQGCRLTLIFNLFRADKQLPLPKPPDYDQEQALVTSLLRNWATSLTDEPDPEIPLKLIYLLEHAYTPAELGFDALKNADAAVAEVLLAAAQQADCDIHLALVSVDEYGSAEYAGDYRRHRYDDEDDYEIVEVDERTETISEWRRPDGKPSPLPVLPFSEHEFCPISAYDNIEPDNIQFQEATGNAGASFDRSYQAAALVIWPKALNLAIISQAGINATLPVLQDLCQRWEDEGRISNSSLWQEAHTLITYLFRDTFTSHRSDRELLICLFRLRNIACIKSYWQKLSKSGFYQIEDQAALVQTSSLIPWPSVVDSVEKAFILSATKAQEACAALLAGLSVAHTINASDLIKSAQILALVLPGDPHRFPELQPWQRSQIMGSTQLVSDVLTSFSAINAELANDTLNYFLTWPTVYNVDTILVSVALLLTESEFHRNLPVVKKLRTAVITHINVRVAMALEPPKDWQRNSKISCKCPDCTALSAFLSEPTQSTWRLKAVEARRKHVELSISRHASDIDCRTQRSGSPHTLVCTKNQASYELRVTQRKQDLKFLSSLEDVSL